MLTESESAHTGREETYFAPAGRLSYQELEEQIQRSLEDPCIRVVLQAVDGYLIILNSKRQILAANREFLDALRMENRNCVVGLRPGEALNCLHFTEGPSGCGTSEHCRSCGATLAMLAVQEKGLPITSECHLSVLHDGKFEARDFRVHCTPLALQGERLLAFVLNDISAVKRREILEETFLHDLLNAIGGIEGWSSLLDKLDPKVAANEILSLAGSLKEEVLSQRMLLEAEKGVLAIHKTKTEATEILSRLSTLFESHPAAQERNIEIPSLPAKIFFYSDVSLLLRVLTNMVKNALEASRPGDTIHISFEWNDRQPRFVVHNPAFIPQDIRAHIFERSFSTKAVRGRGIGTYSMKLFGENYLGGKVSFSTNEAKGTEFSITLPQEGEDKTNKSTPSPSNPGRFTGKHLLFVEDEEALLRLGTLFLQRLGLTVTGCRGGVEALAAFRKSPLSFDACITDLSMPQMNGLELSQQLAAIRPGLPIILSTGFGEDTIKNAKASSIQAVMHKPFTIKELTSALQNAFESKQSASDKIAPINTENESSSSRTA